MRCAVCVGAVYDVLCAVCCILIRVCPSSFRRYLWTAFFSLWAYVWMLLVLQYISPGTVELWEAVVTFVQVRIDEEGES